MTNHPGFLLYEMTPEERIAIVENELAVANVQADAIQEAYSAAVNQMLAMENVGWQLLGDHKDVSKGNDLAASKKLAAQLGEWVQTNPLLGRGREIRNSYLFGEPYEVNTADATSKLSAQQKNVFLRQDNQDAVFSLSALESIEGQRYEAGTAFVLYSKGGKSFQQIPFDQIADIIYDPDNSSVIRYVKREWSVDIVKVDGSRDTETRKVWYPASKYKPGRGERYFTSIGGVDVDIDKRMVVSRANMKPGYVLGVPDCFAAAPWALAYSAYLRDGTKVLAALAEWVWKITPKKRPAAERAATAVRDTRGAGGSLITDMDVQSLPKQDAVDLNTGRPLAAQVASALGISIVVLLSDPGQSGAYGTAQTLADPNRRTMQARRELNTEFLKECLQLIGVENPAVVWSKLAPGTDKEEMDLTVQAWGTGLFDPKEIRPRVADIAQITVLSDDPPEGIMIPNNSESLQTQTDISSPEVAMDGTTSQTNGVGRDNVGMGALSKTKTSKTQAGAEKD